MSKNKLLTIDGNEAVASVVFQVSEVIAIYSITPLEVDPRVKAVTPSV